MTVPHAHQQLAAFDTNYHEPVDTTTQVTRMPGTADAPCFCRLERCRFPFCPWHEEESDD